MMPALFLPALSGLVALVYFFAGRKLPQIPVLKLNWLVFVGFMGWLVLKIYQDVGGAADGVAFLIALSPVYVPWATVLTLFSLRREAPPAQIADR